MQRQKILFARMKGSRLFATAYFGFPWYCLAQFYAERCGFAKRRHALAFLWLFAYKNLIISDASSYILQVNSRSPTLASVLLQAACGRNDDLTSSGSKVEWRSRWDLKFDFRPYQSLLSLVVASVYPPFYCGGGAHRCAMY